MQLVHTFHQLSSGSILKLSQAWHSRIQENLLEFSRKKCEKILSRQKSLSSSRWCCSWEFQMLNSCYIYFWVIFKCCYLGAWLFFLLPSPSATPHEQWTPRAGPVYVSEDRRRFWISLVSLTLACASSVISDTWPRSHGGSIFSRSQHFVVAGGTFTNITTIAPSVPHGMYLPEYEYDKNILYISQNSAWSHWGT